MACVTGRPGAGRTSTAETRRLSPCSAASTICRLYPPVGRSPAKRATTDLRLKSTGGIAGGGSKRLAWRRHRASHSARLVMSAASWDVMPLWLPLASVVNPSPPAGVPQPSRARIRVSSTSGRLSSRTAGLAVWFTVLPPLSLLHSFPEVRRVEPGRTGEP